MIKKLAVLSALLFFTSATAYAQFKRTEDIRVKPPEKWAANEVYGLNLSLGGGYLNGNVKNSNILSKADFDWKINKENTLFVEAFHNYVEYNNNVVNNKFKGSVLYAYSLNSNLNLFLQTTHFKNKFQNIKYKTTNTAGLCFHNFLDGVFKPTMISAGLTPTYEKHTDNTSKSELRSISRVNFSTDLTETAKFNGDVIYMPRLSALSDYQLYVESFIELKVWKEKLAFKITAANEYDSRPYLNARWSFESH